jgi:hypothetical protein
MRKNGWQTKGQAARGPGIHLPGSKPPQRVTVNTDLLYDAPAVLPKALPPSDSWWARAEVQRDRATFAAVRQAETPRMNGTREAQYGPSVLNWMRTTASKPLIGSGRAR